MSKTYLVVGLSRSGHHAVANWICHNFPGKVSFENDFLKDKARNCIIYNNAGKDSAEVYTLENYDLEEKSISISQARWVFVLRDFYNWSASFLLDAYSYSPDVHGRIDLLKKYLRQALNVKIYQTGRCTYVDFNRWFAYREYRADLADELGLNKGDKGLNEIMDYGRGSTFDGMDYDGRAQEMDVLGRWRHVMDNEYFVKLLKDRELLYLTREFFDLSLIEK